MKYIITTILVACFYLNSYSQVLLSELDYAPDSTYFIMSKPGGEFDTITIDSLVIVLKSANLSNLAEANLSQTDLSRSYNAGLGNLRFDSLKAIEFTYGTNSFDEPFLIEYHDDGKLLSDFGNANHYLFRSQLELESGSDNTYRVGALLGQTVINSDQSDAVAFYGNVKNESGATTTQRAGYLANVTNGTGSSSLSEGLSVQVINTGTGTITEANGVKVSAVSTGTTNKFTGFRMNAISGSGITTPLAFVNEEPSATSFTRGGWVIGSSNGLIGSHKLVVNGDGTNDPIRVYNMLQDDSATRVWGSDSDGILKYIDASTLGDGVYDGDSTYWSPKGSTALQSKRQRVGINVNPSQALHVNPEPGATLGDSYATLGDGTNGLVVRTPTSGNNYAGQFFGAFKWWNGTYSSIFEDESGSQGTTGQVWGKKATGRMGWIDDQQGGTNTDNQTLSFASPNLSISGGNTVSLAGLSNWTVSGSDIYRSSKAAIGTTAISSFADLTIGNGKIHFANTTNSAFIGRNAGQNNTQTNQMGIGYQALMNGTGSNATAIGYRAGENNTGGSLLAVGHLAGLNNTGINNAFIGYLSGQNNTTGRLNTFIGSSSGLGNVEGEKTVFIGYNAGQNCGVDVDRSVFIGSETGVDATADFCVGIGADAAKKFTGIFNTAIGQGSLAATTSGANNTAVGARSGRTNITGSGNVFIGYDAGGLETGSNNLYIDNSSTSSPLIYGDFSTNELTVNGELKVTDVTAGPATVLLGRDANDHIVSTPLVTGGMTALNVGTTSLSVAPVQDQGGTTQFRITSDNTKIKITEPSSDDINIELQNHLAELRNNVNFGYTTDGYINFASTENISGSVLSGNTGTDQITTSTSIPVMTHLSGSAVLTGTGCIVRAEIQIRVNQSERASQTIDFNAMSDYVPFSFHDFESTLTTSEEVEAYLDLTISAGTGCVVSILDVAMIVEGK